MPNRLFDSGEYKHISSHHKEHGIALMVPVSTKIQKPVIFILISLCCIQ
jgi:hypothetical protein